MSPKIACRDKTLPTSTVRLAPTSIPHPILIPLRPATVAGLSPVACQKSPVKIHLTSDLQDLVETSSCPASRAALNGQNSRVLTAPRHRPHRSKSTPRFSTSPFPHPPSSTQNPRLPHSVFVDSSFPAALPSSAPCPHPHRPPIRPIRPNQSGIMS
jgi:hypothetical protein